VTKPMKSASVLPVDPAGPADPASARFASAGQARLRASRFGEIRKVLEKRRGTDRVSHEDPQAIILWIRHMLAGQLEVDDARMEPHRDTLRRDGPADPAAAHLLGALPDSSCRRRRAPSHP
jgi:hypothetical protein